MAKYSNLKDLFTAIADAIRSKTGGTGAIAADNFPSAIGGISTQDYSVEDAILTGSTKSYTNHRVEKVKSYLFQGNLNLKDVHFSAVRKIGTGAFLECLNLTEAQFPVALTVEDSAFSGCTSLETVTFTELGYIYGRSFAVCSNLKYLDMLGYVPGDSLGGFIYGEAFEASALSTFIIRSSLGVCALMNTSAFSHTPIANGTGYIYVPAALVEQYKAAENWSTYADQIRAIEDYPDITGV